MKNSLLIILNLLIITPVCYAQVPVFFGLTQFGGTANLGAVFSYNTSTIQQKDLYNFGDSAFGTKPAGSLIKATNGLLYGTTTEGGVNNLGTLFSYNDSTETTTDLYDFGSGDDAQCPYGSLIQINDSLLFGLTAYGGTHNSNGTIFSYNILTGKETVLHDFGSGNDGTYPYGSLIIASDGLLYGLTELGGKYDGGIIFSFNIATSTETIVHNFNTNKTDGYDPYGSLIQASNGLLYGLTSEGGSNGFFGGTIFSYNISSGTESDLYDFGSGSDGYNPYGSLVEASNGLLYGMTQIGGVYYKGIIFSYNGSTGNYSDVHDFGRKTDGKSPHGTFVIASDGLLYGTTVEGGTADTLNGGLGTIFSYSISSNTETTIYNFTGTSGSFPLGDLLEVDSVKAGINQVSVNNNQLSLYPNPTTGQFTINIPGNQNGYTVEIINVLGQTVMKSLLDATKTINLSSQPSGMYFVYLKSEEGIVVGKVVITK